MVYLFPFHSPLPSLALVILYLLLVAPSLANFIGAHPVYIHHHRDLGTLKKDTHPLVPSNKSLPRCHSLHCPLSHTPSDQRMRKIRRTPSSLILVTTLSHPVPTPIEGPSIGQGTTASSQRQEQSTASSFVTLTPQESEVAEWPSHILLGSPQRDFTSWTGNGGLLAVGAAGTLALITTLTLRLYVEAHALVILVTCLLLLLGTSIDLSMQGSRILGNERPHGQSVCSALAFAASTAAIYVWLFLIILRRRTFDIFSTRPPLSSVADGTHNKGLGNLTRTARFLGATLAGMIAIFEVCWRIILLHHYALGWHLQQGSMAMQLIFYTLIWIPLARFCLHDWIDRREVQGFLHWLATTCLFLGCALGTGRISAAVCIVGLSESPLGRLLLLLQLIFFLVTTIAVTAVAGGGGDNFERVAPGSTVFDKPLPRAPMEDNGTHQTFEQLKDPGYTIEEDLEVIPRMFFPGQRGDLCIVDDPRRRQHATEEIGVLPIPPSTPAGVPSSVFFRPETPSLYTCTRQAEYVAAGARERTMSLPLDSMSVPPSHATEIGLQRPQTVVLADGPLSLRSPHRGRSSSLGDMLTKRSSHDTSSAIRRRYEGRVQAERHRRVRSASSDMTHLTVTSFFNQFPAPPALVPVPILFNQGGSGLLDPASSVGPSSTRPSSTSGDVLGSRPPTQSRDSRPFAPSRLGQSVFSGPPSEATSSGGDNSREEIESYHQCDCQGEDGAKQAECEICTPPSPCGSQTLALSRNSKGSLSLSELDLRPSSLTEDGIDHSHIVEVNRREAP